MFPLGLEAEGRLWNNISLVGCYGIKKEERDQLTWERPAALFVFPEDLAMVDDPFLGGIGFLLMMRVELCQ